MEPDSPIESLAYALADRYNARKEFSRSFNVFAVSLYDRPEWLYTTGGIARARPEVGRG